MRHPTSVEMMAEAMDLIVKALDLVDEADAPSDIGAHLDLARERLRTALEAETGECSITWRAFSGAAACPSSI